MDGGLGGRAAAGRDISSRRTAGRGAKGLLAGRRERCRPGAGLPGPSRSCLGSGPRGRWERWLAGTAEQAGICARLAGWEGVRWPERRGAQPPGQGGGRFARRGVSRRIRCGAGWWAGCRAWRGAGCCASRRGGRGAVWWAGCRAWCWAGCRASRRGGCGAVCRGGCGAVCRAGCRAWRGAGCRVGRRGGCGAVCRAGCRAWCRAGRWAGCGAVWWAGSGVCRWASRGFAGLAGRGKPRTGARAADELGGRCWLGLSRAEGRCPCIRLPLVARAFFGRPRSSRSGGLGRRQAEGRHRPAWGHGAHRRNARAAPAGETTSVPVRRWPDRSMQSRTPGTARPNVPGQRVPGRQCRACLLGLGQRSSSALGRN